MSEAQRIKARIKQLESNPYTDTSPRSELYRLKKALPYANTVERPKRTSNYLIELVRSL